MRKHIYIPPKKSKLGHTTKEDISRMALIPFGSFFKGWGNEETRSVENGSGT